MRLARVALAVTACLAVMAAAPAQVAPVAFRAAPGAYQPAPAQDYYFLDFRARSGGFVGHSFIYYGRADARGHVLDAHMAGLYPREQVVSPLLPLLMFPAYVSVAPENPDKNLVAVYRRWLTRAQYARLERVVRKLRASDHWWHPALYNCNDFLGHVARQMGLHAPLGVDVPAGYVRALRQINEP